MNKVRNIVVGQASGLPIGEHHFTAIEKVIFAKPAVQAVQEEIARLGKSRVFFMVSGTLNQKTEVIEQFRAALGAKHVGTYDRMPQHTNFTELLMAAAEAREARADLFLAIGGGSIIDATKMVQICVEHGIEDMDTLETLAVLPGPDGKPVAPLYRGPSARMIVVPTTLNGGEYNAGCLATDPRKDFKYTFYHPEIMPISVILDPEMTRYTPETLWYGSGTRAMDHGIEALQAFNATPLTTASILRGVELMMAGLRGTKTDWQDIEARRSAMHGSWLLSYGLNVRVAMGASHAIGHVLGGTCKVPHFLCTPAMMPGILAFNEPAAGEQQVLLSKAMGAPDDKASDVFRAFMAELGLPTRLAEVNVGPEKFDMISKLTMKEFFIYLNPRQVRSPEQVREILELAA